MKWSRDKPVEPGWYWIKGFQGTGYEPTEVFPRQSDGKNYISLHGLESILPIDHEWLEDCEWQPVHPPQE